MSAAQGSDTKWEREWLKLIWYLNVIVRNKQTRKIISPGDSYLFRFPCGVFPDRSVLRLANDPNLQTVAASLVCVGKTAIYLHLWVAACDTHISCAGAHGVVLGTKHGGFMAPANVPLCLWGSWTSMLQPCACCCARHRGLEMVLKVYLFLFRDFLLMKRLWKEIESKFILCLLGSFILLSDKKAKRAKKHWLSVWCLYKCSWKLINPLVP